MQLNIRKQYRRRRNDSHGLFLLICSDGVAGGALDTRFSLISSLKQTGSYDSADFELIADRLVHMAPGISEQQLAVSVGPHIAGTVAESLEFI
ncbi:hypothetical protein KIN20_022220 [Parelaphostrongylus tenuis]|uniref:Uncharacterized protein n=1 Tax=Parelaphostrongylus tenuis TaxID=148309 RepID=A0AAD5QV87_PARTN|nr:hypothetical protein KIN20_022220 [Parelaphostrongylus tenuis]